MSHPINVEALKRLLAPGGAFSLLHPSYEFREEQQSMLEDVAAAYHENSIALIEAGTGIGKSLAYLLPAILFAKKTGQRTIISTNTITLQEQLLQKDIPLAAQALGIPIKASLVKGMSNYVCLRKLEETEQESYLFSEQESEELLKIHAFSKQSTEGSLKTLPFLPSKNVWEKVSAETDTCTKKRCPHFNDCFVFRARQEAESANILIANHAMLFADLAFREKNKEADHAKLLPDYTRVIVDEAHNMEHIATEFFAKRASYFSLQQIFGKLGGETSGKLVLLRSKIAHFFSKQPSEDALSLLERLTIDLPAMRRQLLERLQTVFQTLFAFFAREAPAVDRHEQKEVKIRLEDKHFASHAWRQEIQELLSGFLQESTCYLSAIQSLISDMDHLKNTAFKEQALSIRHEILAYTTRTKEMLEALKWIADPCNHDSTVTWVQFTPSKGEHSLILMNADLDISDKLVKNLFSKFPTTVLCSATLSTNKNFTFIKQRLGLDLPSLGNKALIEKLYSSPFNYQQQVLFLIPQEIAHPSHPDFIAAASHKIWLSLQACRGNAFVLFTSYGMLKRCYSLLEEKLHAHKFSPFLQGEYNRSTLIEKFKQKERAVLFGTDSFWEGVDVAGDFLRCVIIVKLPFKVPTEPLIEARTHFLAKQGKNPFVDFSIPHAIVKFKQGFGRLIRNKEDRGCIVCLDCRLTKKNYGKLFLSSLPECRLYFSQTDEDFYKEIKHFYQLKTRR